MSHLAKIETRLDNLEAAKKAIEEMGFTHKAITRMAAFSWENNNMVLQLQKDNRDLMIGLDRKEDGSLGIVADWWGTGLNSTEFVKDLTQLHTKHKVLALAGEKGYTTESCEYVTNDEGKKLLKLTLSAWDTGDNSGSYGSDFGSSF